MKLTDLVNILFTRSGQFIVGYDLAKIKLNLEQFWLMFRADLENYETYCPVVKSFNITTTNNKFDFTDHANGIPRFISKVVPVGLFNVVSSPIFAGTSMAGAGIGDPNAMKNPQTLLWEYHNPELVISQSGEYAIEAHYAYTKTETRVSEVLTEVDIEDLVAPKQFFWDIANARFMMIIGHSRGAFTFQDLPIITNAPDLIAKGEALMEKGLKEMYERHDWSSSIRP